MEIRSIQRIWNLPNRSDPLMISAGSARADADRPSTFPKLAYAALTTLGLLGLAVVYIVDPRIQGNYPVCPFLGVTGFHCPGCGTLRALHMLLRGDIIAMFGYNLFAMLSLPFIAYSFLSGATRAFLQRSLPTVFIPHRWIWALLATIIAFWTLRNVPIEPFTVLAP